MIAGRSLGHTGGTIDKLETIPNMNLNLTINEFKSNVENQIQGGVAQGIGWALNEEYYYDNKGVMNNSSFLDYRMPVALDLPMIECEIVEVENPGSPFGIRGVGEVPLAPPLAAIQDAIYNAVNVRLFDTPMNPARIVNALMNGH